MSFKTKQLDQHINLGHDRKKDIAPIYYTTKSEQQVYREIVEVELWIHLIRFLEKDTARSIIKAMRGIKDLEAYEKLSKALMEVGR